MFRLLLSLVAFVVAFALSAFQATPPAGDPPAGDPPAGDPPKQDDPPKPPAVKFDAEQEAEKNRQVAAARRQAEKDAAAKFEKDAKDRETAAAAKKAEDEALARGEFDKVKGEIEARATAAQTEAETYKGRYETAIEAIKPGVDTRWTDLPDEVKALYAGADDDILAKHAHLEKTAALVAKLAGSKTPRIGLTPDADPNARAQIKSPITGAQITG